MLLLARGEGRLGAANPPGSFIGTAWNSSDVWLRREVELPAGKLNDVRAWLHHDEDAEVYINGVQALRASGFSTGYDAVPLNRRGQAALKPGRNVIAIHCHQTSGGQYIDCGLVDVESN